MQNSDEKEQKSPRSLAGNASEIDQPKQQPSDRELLVQIVKMQTMLNSKMFEFMRAYQQQHNWGNDQNLFRDGSGRKTKVADLFDEVNQIGYSLDEIASAFVEERLHEKRDENGLVLAHCKVCGKEAPFKKKIDSPYGLSDAYFDGSERLVCTICDSDTIYPGDERLPQFNSVFSTK